MFEFGYDHAFSRWISCEQYERFKKLGFSTQSEHVVEHEGGQLCRFLAIGDKKYLEFVEIKNDDVFLKTQKEIGQQPYPTGVSFRVNKNLKNFFTKKEASFKKYDIQYVHKNYDWKNNSTASLPGWNFIFFRKPLYPGIEIWFTEYETDPVLGERKSRLSLKHDNECTHVLGIVLWDRSQKLGPILEELLERKNHHGEITLHDQSKIWITDTARATLGDVSYKKESPFLAVVLKTENLEYFKNNTECTLMEFFGKQAYRIEQHSKAYDVIVTA
ncbi:MAG: hypothetical protein HY390_03745 [Deltaproteobacteria bacterium]|nr:hypothetical protein [Deltaproteobacteria bacterium]